MTQELSDLELIENIQLDVNTQNSLTQLIDRHSGIYLDMVNVYASPSSPFIDYEDLIEDKDFKIYQAAKNYNPEKGAKFSTYLGNETKWMCLNLYNRNKRKPAFQSEFLENLSSAEQIEIDSISESVKNDLFDKVLNIIRDHPDKRVEKIFKMRYITGSKNKVMPWKNIGYEMNLSIQGCINIHNSAIEHVQHELKQEI